jgi:protein arginine N-methyltransferase 5
MFPHTTFLRNAKGFPVLSKGHQQYLTQFMRLRQTPWILLVDVDPIEAADKADVPEPTPAEAANAPTAQDPVPHLRYLRHLQQTQPVRAPIERFGQGYQDYMQSPLQPLSDNLESVTYEVFEKDPIKYDWYERAVALALKDLSAKVGGREIIVAVVGAGRGPLVSKALMASKTSGVKIKAWAVEKNQNAYVHLQRRNIIDPLWNKNVTVVKTDMRAWKGPIIDGKVHKVDILVSELLGSFADNELSPECLDGVQHVLDPTHGVNIPQSYSAHMTPIATPRLYNDLLGRGGSEKWEIPYVVMFQQFDFLSLKAGGEEESAEADVQDAWMFSHPAPTAVLEQAEARRGGSAEHGGAGGAVGGDGSNEHNSRACKVKFTVQNRGICHGLAGYFESVLYASESGEKVELSTNPVTMEAKSCDMISWFPIFFPLKVSLHAFLLKWLTTNRITDPHQHARQRRSRSQHVAPDRRPQGVVRMGRESLHQAQRQEDKNCHV